MKLEPEHLGRTARGFARNLRWHIRVRLLTYPDAQHVQEEAAELRALLRVARAAKRVMAYNGCGRKFCGTGLDRDCPAVKQADSALASLDRVSGVGSKGRRSRP